MAQPLVTLIIPAFDVEEFLPACLDSILNQSYSNLEILVVDDGSTDGTQAVAQEYARKDRRVRVISKPNGGVSSARNAGFDQAAGEFVCHVDSDDFVSENYVARLVERAQESGADLVMCLAWVFNDGTQSRESPHCHETSVIPEEFDGRVFGLKDIQRWCFQMEMAPWAKLLRTSFVKRSGARFPEGFFPEDVPFLFEAMAAGAKMTLIREQLYCHRINRKGSIWTDCPVHKFEYFRAVPLVKVALEKNGLYQSMRPEFYIWKYGWLMTWIFEIEPPEQLKHSKKLIAEARADRSDVADAMGAQHWLAFVVEELTRTKPEEIRYPILAALWYQLDPREPG